MTQLTITHPDNSTETIAETVGWERTREIGGMRRVRIDVDRSLAQNVTLNRKADEIALGSIDDVRLVDIETGGPTWTLVCYSFEWDANKVEPIAGGTLRQDTDQGLINTIVGNVSNWSAGTVNSFTNQLEFVFNHAHRHEALRRIERNVPGEIQFRDSGTVDYLQRLGSDKTGSITLSDANSNIEEAIQITNRGRELDGTHIRVIGAHEGEAQIFCSLVPSGDSGNYENEVTYTTSKWSDASDTDWDVWANKDVTEQDTIEEEASALANEITEDLVEAETVVENSLGLELGDTVHVEKADADLDRDMRVHRITTRQEGATRRDHLLLSTRTTVRQGDTDLVNDIKRYNTAFEGSSVWGTISGGYQAVSSGINYQLGAFDYPQIPYEHEATLWVKSVPYRTFSSGAASGGDHIHTIENLRIDANEDASERVNPGNTTIGTSWGSVYSWTRTAHRSSWLVATVLNLSADSETLRYRVQSQTTTTPATIIDTVPDTTGIETQLASGDTTSLPLFVDTNSGGGSQDIELQMISDSGEFGLEIDAIYRIDIDNIQRLSQTSDASGDHTHPADPGVSEFGGETASGVDVLVNGSTEAVNIGSGTFETTVDLTDTLTPGQFNNIELASDSLGGMFAAISIDAYRKIGIN